jgi:hypothetical protein
MVTCLVTRRRFCHRCSVHPTIRPDGFRHRAFETPRRIHDGPGINSAGHDAARSSPSDGRSVSRPHAPDGAVDTHRSSKSDPRNLQPGSIATTHYTGSQPRLLCLKDAQAGPDVRARAGISAKRPTAGSRSGMKCSPGAGEYARGCRKLFNAKALRPGRQELNLRPHGPEPCIRQCILAP